MNYDISPDVGLISVSGPQEGDVPVLQVDTSADSVWVNLEGKCVFRARGVKVLVNDRESSLDGSLSEQAQLEEAKRLLNRCVVHGISEQAGVLAPVVSLFNSLVEDRLRVVRAAVEDHVAEG
jgi:hypothetical protein